MTGMIGIVALLTVLFLSLMITRLAAVALRLTGLSSDAASFQARSAFTGVGYTTREAEKLVNHPVRRRILTLLMITRSAGLVTIVISLILSFGQGGAEDARMVRLLWLLGGVIVLWAFSANRWVERGMNRVMEWALRKWTRLDAVDYIGLLNLEGEYMVRELKVDEDDWLAGKSLKDSHLVEEGVTVLGIYREDGEYIGVPNGDTEVVEGDTLILYGRGKRLEELSDRQSDAGGEAAHDEAVSEQHREMADQKKKEEKQKRKRDH